MISGVELGGRVGGAKEEKAKFHLHLTNMQNSSSTLNLHFWKNRINWLENKEILARVAERRSHDPA